MKSEVAFIALGSNLGDSAIIIRAAMDRLQQFSDELLLKSSLWKSTPVDCPLGSPNFVNAVVALMPRITESPETLLEKLQALEREFGRRQKQLMNEPRPLDLDLIAFGDQRRASEELKLPHPRAHERRFVLEPLAEIAPDFIFPGQKNKVSEQLRSLTTAEILRRI